MSPFLLPIPIVISVTAVIADVVSILYKRPQCGSQYTPKNFTQANEARRAGTGRKCLGRSLGGSHHSSHDATNFYHPCEPTIAEAMTSGSCSARLRRNLVFAPTSENSFRDVVLRLDVICILQETSRNRQDRIYFHDCTMGIR
jgi:hypothetical protein